MPAAGDQRPDLFEFCKLWTRHRASADLLLPPPNWSRRRKRRRPDDRAGSARHDVHVGASHVVKV
jgi:hypothetical protein